ncbi:catalase-like domain-containing protein [Circinella umbellata]|nr:catalase-like domain-containing protein [Circinella umbellata]
MANHSACQNDASKACGSGQKAMEERLEAFSLDNKNTQETTTTGVKVDNRNTLKAGCQGPSLMQDFAFQDKIMHFDHERIPERVVHARGVGAHGYFEAYKDWSDLTAADFLRNPGKKTPVFVRFSTVLGSRGSPDTVRDVRGFATRFYTDEGLFDLVGNVIAPFFVHDAIKFPDIIHSGKPKPSTDIPQAGTAHDTAYDFFGSFPETIHTVMWALSGRGIVKSFRQVDGFGVHTFRLINEQGKSIFVKFHWKPLQGLSNLLWDEAQKIGGKNIDFHRQDLYTAIDKGDYPEYELGVQIIEEEDANKYPYLLDPTKLVPESLVPVTPLGKMTLNRNVENFFAETEQVAFCVSRIVRGIGFTNDSLLQGRLFSYPDTQINRMNSVNNMQLPINRPINGVHNNQRDGYMQTNIHKGDVTYFPNHLGGNAPAIAEENQGGYIEYPEKIEAGATKIREQVSTVDDHYSQAQLYWNSLTVYEKQQTVDGLRFEVGKSVDLGVRKRMIDVLNHVDNGLARRVAAGVNVPLPDKVADNPGHTTVGLSIEERPHPPHIKTKTVAILTAPGTNVKDAQAMYDFLKKEGAYVEYVGPALGDQEGLEITQTYTTTSSVLFDAVYIPDGSEAIKILTTKQSTFPYGEPSVFVMDAFRHCKPIGASGAGVELLKLSKVEGGEKDGVFIGEQSSGLLDGFKNALIKQRYWTRLALDPPM